MRTLTAIAVVGLLATAWAEEPKKTPAEKTDEILTKTRIDLDFAESGLADVADFISGFSHVSILIDPAVVENLKPVTCALKNLAMKDSIDSILADQGLKSVNRNGVLIWTSAAKAPQLEKRPLPTCPKDATEEERDTWNKAASVKLSLNFADTPTNEVLGFLKDVSGMAVVVEVGQASPVTLKLGETTLVDLLDWMAFQLGGRLTVRAGTLVITGN